MIRSCTECGRPFDAPPHGPGQSAVWVCDRHTKPKPRKKTDQASEQS